MNINIYFIDAALGILAGVLGALQYMRNRHKEVVKELVRDGLKDVVTEVMEAAVAEQLHPFDTRLTVIETKMDVFWKGVALDAAKMLHHPEPSRYHVDELLDKFINGSLSDEESEELRGYLETIRDWEPGQAAPFRIFQGEQVAASILLHTMHHVTSGFVRGGR